MRGSNLAAPPRVGIMGAERRTKEKHGCDDREADDRSHCGTRVHFETPSDALTRREHKGDMVEGVLARAAFKVGSGRRRNQDATDLFTKQRRFPLTGRRAN